MIPYPLAALARALEQGRWRSRAAQALGATWARRARATRPVALPRGAAVIGIGGTTLGGSYKTPLTLALSRALADHGATVAVVAHGYGGAQKAARSVLPGDTPQTVGDDAVWLHRELSGSGAPVIVGRRSEAIALAARRAPITLVDALLQTEPVRLALSVLAVDALSPWGAGLCPPSGDLRASKAALLRAADVVAAIISEQDGPSVDASLSTLEHLALAADRPVLPVASELVAARADGGPAMPLSTLAGVRLGLVLAIARPERVVAALLALRLRRPAHPADAWLTTPKCATKLGSDYEGAPLIVLRQRLSIPSDLLRRCLLAAPHEP